MGRLSNSELYVNINQYREAVEIEGMKIFNFSCALFFMNRHTFKESLYKKVLNISSYERRNANQFEWYLNILLKLWNWLKIVSCQILSNDIDIYIKDGIRGKSQINTIIIDCSSIFYIDSAGVETIIEVIKELKQIKINVVLASCHQSVISMLQKSNFFFDKYSIYASVHDAVIKCLSFNDMTSV